MLFVTSGLRGYFSETELGDFLKAMMKYKKSGIDDLLINSFNEFGRVTCND